MEEEKIEVPVEQKRTRRSRSLRSGCESDDASIPGDKQEGESTRKKPNTRAKRTTASKDSSGEVEEGTTGNGSYCGGVGRVLPPDINICSVLAKGINPSFFMEFSEASKTLAELKDMYDYTDQELFGSIAFYRNKILVERGTSSGKKKR